MESEHRKSTKSQLALALARGISPAKWARENDVTKMTAYRWAKEPEVRKAVESYRCRMIDLAVGRMSSRTAWAADGIASIAKDGTSDSVRLRAFRSIFSDMLTVSSYSGLTARMSKIEERLGAKEVNDGRPGCVEPQTRPQTVPVHSGFGFGRDYREATRTPDLRIMRPPL